ncbi:hypothetical protein [Galbibacter sp. PAP.153]|uniref:hypothetical protein n=1 Tax=Galbibacter sp. PAP.153 TaxID=3104623 RepID=UPI00300B4D4A
MNKLTSILSKIAATLNIDTPDKKGAHNIVGKWKALTYTEKLYENDKLINEDDFSYNGDNAFSMVFKKNGNFIQNEHSKDIQNNSLEKTTKKGTYALEGDKVILTYGSVHDDKNVIALLYTINENKLTTVNDYKQKDIDDVYHHVSTRTFIKE